jgi:hypothetical protein
MLSISFSNAQNINYTFNNRRDDTLNQFSATNYFLQEQGVLTDAALFQNFTGFSTYLNESNCGSNSVYVNLQNNDYIGLPRSILEQWQANETLGINLRFRFSATEPVAVPNPCCPDKKYRTIIAAHAEDQREGGLHLSISKIEQRCELIRLVGDGTGPDNGLLGEDFRFSLA